MRSAAAALGAALLALGGVAATAPAASADQVREDQYWLDEYGIREAWRQTKGEGVTVAVIDTGVDSSHPDLRGKVVDGIDVSGAGNSDGTEPIGELPEHGTLVATLLAGHGNNTSAIARAKAESEKQRIAWERAARAADRQDKKRPPRPDPVEVPEPGPGSDGVIGVAPAADLLSVSLWLGSQNPGGVPVEDQVPLAVRWAVDQGAEVINMSLGSTQPDWPTSWDSAFLYAEQHDVVVVAAAGNRAGGMVQVGAPATIPGVLTVAGVDRSGEASWDSSTQGISIGVAAPADPLVGGLPGGGYAQWSGSSGAAPIVAGVVALIRSQYPDLTADQVVHRVLATARDAGEPGVDSLYGHGLVDAAAAVSADVPPVEANPLGTIAEWIRVHRRGESPAPSPDPAPAPDAESTVPPVAAPDPAAPEAPAGALPAVLVGGFGLLLAGIAAAGTVHVARLRRGGPGVAEGTVAGRNWAPGRGSRDPFDDLPEGSS